ncbi:HWE histidine kinase domain-containing protein [uncultured Jannaschia sp.]|uniref:HWE histidine kinase domain-containing protein n=1 Tax=uncultured Jannaschia sp. TaxID=293347 RepID=UPI002602072D|nr:HWE histidine kinase domain-containing protein [uncultured Jannaschia sp.]
MNEWIDPSDLALDNCDREPIHRPGRIQPFGAMLIGPLDLSRIDFASTNLAEVLDHDAKSVLGQSFHTVLDPKVLHDIRNMLTLPTAKTQRERVGVAEVAGRRIEVFAHRSPDDRAVVELEPVQAPSVGDREHPIDRMRLFLAHASRQDTLNRFLQSCVHGLRDLLGYDRVLAYRYSANGDGEVVAEARMHDIESLLGLRYPAWDVPTQARTMQIKAPLRMLSDVHQTPVGLLGHTEDPESVDISLAHLRGVSPIHVEYLANMGVHATLTIGLIVEGRLWGMFACHHRQPRTTRSDVRIAAELFGQMVSLLIQQRTEVEMLDARNKAEAARRRILAETDAATDLLHSFPEMEKILAKVIACDGLAIIRDDKLQTSGSVPSAEAIRAIGNRRPSSFDLVEGTTTLAAEGWAGSHDLGASAGCLIIRCAAVAPLQLLFFRDEKLLQVTWAGKPQKDVSIGPHGARLSPRGSFEAYSEEQKGRSVDWTGFDLEAASELQRLLTQITARGERAEMNRHKDLMNYQRQQDLMIAELNHRVKNILALIRSLSRQAKASSASLESYAQALEQRIAALAAAHDLAVSNSMSGVSLRGILETELAPFLSEDSAQVLMSGPLIGLRPDVAPMIALVFHEVVTNATKYGALSTSEGLVRTKWTIEGGELQFSWKELGGPEVKEPERHGFGRTLIEKAIPYEFDGTVEMDYAPSGVTMSFRLPADTLIQMTEETPSKVVGKITEIRQVASGARILLVEDNIVLSMDMVESLTRRGADVVETAATVEEALRLIRKEKFDAAILDMNLRGVVSFAVGDELMAKGVPFMFVTGYGSTVDVPPSFKDVPILTKPVDDGTLAASLAELLPSDLSQP